MGSHIDAAQNVRIENDVEIENPNALKEEGEETIAISLGEGKKLILYPPLWRMLREPPVKEALEAIVKGKMPQALHTQNRENSGFSPISLLEETEELAETVVRKSAVLSEMKEIRSTWKKKRDRTRYEKSWKSKQMSQTMAYLQAVMGKDFTGHKAKSKDLVMNFLSKYAYFKGFEKDTDYVDALARALEDERGNANKVAFWHATDEFGTMFYDVISEFRRQMQNLPGGFTIFRADDAKFANILNVHEFITNYSDTKGRVDNYTQKDGIAYQDLAISANLFLFGSDEIVSSATYKYFKEHSSSQPPDYKKLFDTVMSDWGISAKYSDFLQIFQRYTQKNNEKNSKLYGIFLDNEVDKVAYLAGSYGMVKKIGDYYGFSQIMPEMKNNIKEFGKEFGDLNKIQARVFLNPDILHSKHVQIKGYWHHPIDEKAYKNALEKRVRQDLLPWLTSASESTKKIFHEGKPAIKKLFHYAYENITNLKYKKMVLQTIYELPLSPVILIRLPAYCRKIMISCLKKRITNHL